MTDPGTPDPNAISLLEVPAQPRTRTSDVLLSLIEGTRAGDVTLRDLADRMGDRTFGVMLVVFAALNLVPFVSLVMGLLITLLGLQMALGFKRVRLPARILDRVLPADKVAGALLLMEPKVRAIEAFLRPRWRFTEAPIFDRFIGLMVAFLGIIIALPVPLANAGPALVVVVMGLGLLERDGLVQMLALAFGLLVTGLLYSLL